MISKIINKAADIMLTWEKDIIDRSLPCIQKTVLAPFCFSHSSNFQFFSLEMVSFIVSLFYYYILYLLVLFILNTSIYEMNKNRPEYLIPNDFVFVPLGRNSSVTSCTRWSCKEWGAKRSYWVPCNWQYTF